MSEIRDGGPAFPIGSGDMRDPQGMSLRDYFVAHEKSEPPFETINLAAEYLGIDPEQYDWMRDWPRVVAKWRGAMADAMLQERER